jgi:hypothetical protein
MWQAEREMGRFESSGNFVWRKDPGDVSDPWLAEQDEVGQGVSQGERAALRDAHRRRLEEEAKAAAGDGVLGATAAPPLTRPQLLENVLSCLLPGETVPAALRRFGAYARPQAGAAGSAPVATGGGSAAAAAAASTGAGATAAGAPAGKLSWRQQKAAREAARAGKGKVPSAAPAVGDGGAAGAAPPEPGAAAPAAAAVGVDAAAPVAEGGDAGTSAAAAGGGGNASAAPAMTAEEYYAGMAFTMLTEAADQLMAMGMSSVYTDSREALVRRLQAGAAREQPPPVGAV